MREIKFRAWEKRYSAMRPKVNIVNGIVCLPDGGIMSTAIPMQFTGLHDKNGKEIYEGDVVRVVTKDFNEPDVVDAGKVQFTRGHWQVNSKQDSYYLYGQDELEVIGNIYENAELLTK